MPAAVETMMYRGETPWHGLGQHISENISIEDATIAAGFTWKAHLTPVIFQTQPDDYYYMDDRRVIYRDDTNAPLGIVSDAYEIVQPNQVMEFFRDIVQQGDFEIETAGVLDGGRKLWALAKATPQHSQRLTKDDPINPYLFLATSMDGTMATNASFTTVRIVCQNTLQMALANTKSDRIRVTHRGKFNAQKVQTQLGLLDESMDNFMEQADILASTKISQPEAREFLAELFVENYVELTDDEKQKALERPTMQSVWTTYNSFPGQQTKSAKGTMWGVVNGVTAYLDHQRNARTIDARLNNIWFGSGKQIKEVAMKAAIERCA